MAIMYPSARRGKSILIAVLLMFLGPGDLVRGGDLEVEASLLDGTTIIYQYVNGWAFKVGFDNGRGHWEAIAGEYEGQQSEGFDYKAHRLDHGLYVVQWDEKHGKDLDFVTLHLNFNTNQIFASSLLYYGVDQSEPKSTHFEPGIIMRVERK